MVLLADYNTTAAAAINSEAAQNFGITNMTGMYSAMMSSAAQVQKICMPVVSLALLLQFFLFMTKLYGERTVDYKEIGKVLLLMLFLFNYSEIMMQINSVISYFTDSMQIMFDKYGSGHTLIDKVNDVYDSYKKKHPDPGFFSGLTNFMDWIIANCTHMIIVVARAVTYIIRSLSMIFLFVTGPIAILATMFPGFEGTLKHWLTYYVQVGFWMVTLGILDMILYQYLQYCEDNQTIDA